MTDTELKAYLDGFTNEVVGDIKRPLFVLFARKGSTGNYEAIGYKQESLGISNNYDEESVTDVLGIKHTNKNDKDEQIEMSEYHINKDKSAFLDTPVKYTIGGLENELEDYELLMVLSWLKDSDGNMLARRVTGVTLTLDNIGGQSYTMADVTFSGISQGEFGTVSDLKNPEFSPAE